MSPLWTGDGGLAPTLRFLACRRRRGSSLAGMCPDGRGRTRRRGSAQRCRRRAWRGGVFGARGGPLADRVQRVTKAVLIKVGKAGFGEAKLSFRDQGGGRDAVHAGKIARMGVGVQFCGWGWCAVAHPTMRLMCGLEGARDTPPLARNQGACAAGPRPPSPLGGRFCSVGHPNFGGRGGTIKCLRRPLQRPPEGGRGPRVVRRWVGRGAYEYAPYGEASGCQFSRPWKRRAMRTVRPRTSYRQM